MFRPTSTFALIGVALAAASCRSSPSEQRREEWDKGALIHRKLVGYHTIVSAHKGKVGFLRIENVTEGGGNPYPWKYVQDVDHNELGFINQFGGAVKYHFYSPAEAATTNQVLRGDRLPADSLENNVMRILGIDVSTDELTFPEATQSDITGDMGSTHLAGPGITPSKGPVEAAKPAAK